MFCLLHPELTQFKGTTLWGTEIFTIPHQKQAVIREALFLKAPLSQSPGSLAHTKTILELSVISNVRTFPSGATYN